MGEENKFGKFYIVGDDGEYKERGVMFYGTLVVSEAIIGNEFNNCIDRFSHCLAY